MELTEKEIQDEVVLMQQFRAGSEEAFTMIYRHLYQRVFWFARKFMEEAEDARDLTAEAFIQLWQQNHQLKDLNEVAAFLFVIVRNKCYNLLKHRQMKAGRKEELLRQLNEREQGDFLEEQVQLELVHRIYTEVNKLAPRMKEIFLLSYRDGLKPAEIATLLQIKAQTVTNQRVTAIRILQLALGKDFMLSFLLLVECGFLL
ncbi:MAG: RNA polymerase sigma factor [Pseudobacter sp.]|uniref:RNA polymerase sigma factor n=1 Tax=Pseudobacter sp. TaxID=2045420 RepID=UPI003F813F62